MYTVYSALYYCNVLLKYSYSYRYIYIYIYSYRGQNAGIGLQQLLRSGSVCNLSALSTSACVRPFSRRNWQRAYSSVNVTCCIFGEEALSVGDSSRGKCRSSPYFTLSRQRKINIRMRVFLRRKNVPYIRASFWPINTRD